MKVNKTMMTDQTFRKRECHASVIAESRHTICRPICVANALQRLETLATARVISGIFPDGYYGNIMQRINFLSIFHIDVYGAVRLDSLLLIAPPA